jgi:hypothetical protein
MRLHFDNSQTKEGSFKAGDPELIPAAATDLLPRFSSPRRAENKGQLDLLA